MLSRDETTPPRNAVMLQEYVHRASQGVCDCSGTAFLSVPERQLILAEQHPACGCYYHVIDIVGYSRDRILIRSALWGKRKAKVCGGSVLHPFILPLCSQHCLPTLQADLEAGRSWLAQSTLENATLPVSSEVSVTSVVMQGKDLQRPRRHESRRF